jgi:phage terminase small subunit
LHILAISFPRGYPSAMPESPAPAKPPAKPHSKLMELSAAQRYTCFARAYVFTHQGNGTKAAIAAGYSPRSAYSTASMLLKNPKVRARIEEMQARAAAKLELTPKTVLDELAKLGLSNMADYVDDEGKFVGMVGLTRDQTAAIQELEIDEKNGKRKVKLANKRESLELLAKHFKVLGADDHGVGNQIQVIVVNSPRPLRTEEMIGPGAVDAILEAQEPAAELEVGPPGDCSEE